MRRFIILFIVLCLHIATRGQTIGNVDLSGLPQPTQAKALRYWFDDATNNVKTVSQLSGQHLLDVTHLNEGLHTLHFQLRINGGKVAYVISCFFLKTDHSSDAESVSASKLMYWFDEETMVQNVDISQGTQMIDASGLTDGLHTIHYQVLCNNGQMTPVNSSLFLCLSIDSEMTVAKTLRYWFDNEQAVKTVAITNGILMLDASRLIDGLHTLHYQIRDSEGVMGIPASSLFLKMNYDNTTAQGIRYWFDNDTDVRTTSVTNGTQTLDVSNLSIGLHTLNYQLIDSNKKVSAPVTGIFLKIFDKVIESEQNGIAEYYYWLNDNDTTVKTVTLDQTTNPYTLIALLPVQNEPIRSSCYHFEIKDNQPMMYAKNDFHIRFADAAGYFVDGSKQFIDYSVKQEVEPIQSLEGYMGDVLLNKPAPNDIIWYTMQAASGDTIAFKLSQPATIQLFAPSGTEVFNTSESASVNWNGIHTWEDGTYYLAVHDVTGSQSTMKLEYMHMDKYDVVDWDVHRVGNGGCSTITFKGNGFRDLYAVDLVIAPGDTIHSVDVSHDSDAETAVTFDFTGAALGDYNAVFHFTEEDKPVANVVTVEEAIDIELATDVSFPSSFLRGTSTTYTIKITNKGNMTAYAIPVYTYVMNKLNKDGIYHIEYDGLDLPGLFDGVDMDSLSANEKDELQTFSKEMGDSHYFIKFRGDNEDSPSDCVWVRSNYFFTNIVPYETKTLQLSLSANEGVWAYFTVPEDWPSYSYEQKPNGAMSAKARFKSQSLKEKYCCVADKIDCIATNLGTALDFASVFSGLFGYQLGAAINIADCAVSSGGAANKTIKAIVCDSNKDNFNPWLAAGEVFVSTSQAGLSCISAKLFKYGIPYLKIYNPELKSIGDMISKLVVALDAESLGLDALHGKNPFKCLTELAKPSPGCPPTPRSGGSSTPYVPRDPNDICGYLSEAGSKFIADSVARVNYTIEFENDTTFATAAAHTIVIKDTLDSWYFDLTKFMPTGVRIGSREAFLNEADVVTNNDKTTFVKTIDMRPEINAIAQVNGEFNPKNGIAQWTFQSLDPMTMEPTDDLMQGILPVNYNGTSGIGEVMFEVGLKSGKADGTKIDNRAGIVFDYEEAILTPTWTNIVDAVPPSSIVDGLTMLNDSTLRVFANAEDARSGVWKYEWYVQHGENAPWWKEGETYDDCFDFHFYEGFDYGFCVVVTDSAGNVEKKELARERIFKSYGPDFDNAVSISPLTASPNVEGQVYDLSGRRHDKPQEGINIIDKKKVLFRRKGK